jgi:hypothetical protein
VALRWLLPRRVWPYLDTGLGHFILLMLIIVPLLATVFGMFYLQELGALTEATGGQRALEDALRSGFFKAYMALLLLGGIVAWWLVLAHKSRQVAQEESNRQPCRPPRQLPSAPSCRPSRPTMPRAATSAPSATNCARRSIASWVMPN